MTLEDLTTSIKSHVDGLGAIADGLGDASPHPGLPGVQFEAEFDDGFNGFIVTVQVMT